MQIYIKLTLGLLFIFSLLIIFNDKQFQVDSIYLSVVLIYIIMLLIFYIGRLTEKSKKPLEINSKHKDMELDFNTILDHSNDFFYMKDSQYRFRSVNDNFAKLTGHEHWSQIAGKTDFDVFPKEDAQKYRADDMNVIERGESVHARLESYTMDDGTVGWVQTSKMPVTDEDGKVIRMFGFSTDVTELIKAREVAERLTQAKSEFFSNISHELRTPLNAILGFSSILTKKQTDSSHKELSNTINISAKSLLKLINDILDLAKIEDSNFTIEPYEFNAYKELEEFSWQFEGLTNKKVLIYNINIDNKLKGIFFGDWDRISQIILNLVSNAVKFTPVNGLITLNGDYKDDNLILCVTDNGIGMNKEVQDKIFEPFAQADGSITRKYGGTGLGLSITQSLVGLMGGYIELESAEGVGTTLKVTIPLKKVQEQRREDTQVQIIEEDKEDILKGHILIVEDNKTNQMLVKMLITDFGLTCDVANDGLEAVGMYEPQKHLLVLMDENMPNMNGIEAMKAIKEKHQEEITPIIALTANAMKGDRERFLSLGMDDYIEKPIDEDELYRVLKEFL